MTSPGGGDRVHVRAFTTPSSGASAHRPAPSPSCRLLSIVMIEQSVTARWNRRATLTPIIVTSAGSRPPGRTHDRMTPRPSQGFGSFTTSPLTPVFCRVDDTPTVMVVKTRTRCT